MGVGEDASRSGCVCVLTLEKVEKGPGGRGPRLSASMSLKWPVLATRHPCHVAAQTESLDAMLWMARLWTKYNSRMGWTRAGMDEPPLCPPLSHPPASPAQHGMCLQWTAGRAAVVTSLRKMQCQPACAVQRSERTAMYWRVARR